MVDKSEKYERIITHASLLFAASDFQSVCMEDVANAAKVGKGTLYNYFQSKDDLYFSILHDRLENFLQVLTKACSRRNDFLKNMRSLTLHLHKFLAGYPHFHKIWTREEHSIEKANNAAIFELKERILNLIEKVVEQGKSENLLQEDLDSAFAAQVVYCLINYVKYEKNPDKLFSILMKGIGKEGLDISVEYESYKHENKK